MRKIVLFMVAFLLTMSQTWAQETTSEISGLISAEGKGLQGVTIIATHQPTGTKYTTTSRADGRYNLPNLRVGGPYEIVVTSVGYKKEVANNITLLLGQEFKEDFSLTTEAQQLAEVVVTGGRENRVINRGRTGAQEIINRTQIERLPTINRSLQDFTKLEPTSNGLSFGGRSNQYNNVTVDGANFNNSFGLSGTLGGQANAQPISLDAIEQIQVNVAPYDVRQGGFSGAGVNSVTRSGSNQFRGSVYYYTKGENSQGYKVGNTTVPKTPFTYHIAGANLGGYFVKNKLFFFVSVEQVRQSAPATSFIASDAAHPPVPGSVSQANADTLQKLKDFLVNKFGYDPGAFAGYTFNQNSDKLTAKIDWNINSKNTFTFKYNYLKSYSDQFASTSRPSPLITGGQPGNSSMPFYGSGYVINNNFNIFIAELNTRFSSNLSNKFQAGYTALRDFRTPHSNSGTFPMVDILDGNGSIYTTFGYEPYTYNNLLNTDVYQISDILTYFKGSHEITVGTQDYYRKYANAFAPGYQGAYQFNTLTDFFNSVNNGTANAKSYYLQYSALKGGEFPWAYAGSTEIGLFAQDKWRATNNFTLTYGLRVDFTKYKQSFTDNPYFDALTFANGKQYNIGSAPAPKPLISPRVGFNWDVFGDKSLQIRGGAGIFSGPPPFVWISNQASNNGIQFGSIATSNVAFNADPTAYRPAANAPNVSYSTALVSDNFKYPTVFKSSIAADKRFAGDIVATVEGTYSKDINAVYYSNINLKETNGFALNGADNRMRYLTSVSNSNKYYYGSTLANPNIGTAILMDNTQKGYAFTLTGRVQKTTKNFYGSIAYTYSVAKNAAEGGSTASSLWSARPVHDDPNGANLAYASFYQPHRIIATAYYKVEYAKYFATSIGLTFEASPQGILPNSSTQQSVFSYVYNGDLNGDGQSGNDLIYIPRSLSEINLVKVGSGGSGTGTSTDPRTASQIWAQLNNFMNQDKYLSEHRGQYAEANAIVFPFYKRLDMNLTQDISAKFGANRHTIRLTLDIINLGNLLNKDWGLMKTPVVNNFLKFEGMAADGKTPSFSFPYQDATNQIPYTSSFSNSTNIASRWQMQFGVRYLFN